MTFGSLLNAIFRHRPTAADIDKAKELAEAVETFIAALKSILPEADGKAQAIEAVKNAELHANMALARGAVGPSAAVADVSPATTGHQEG